VISSDDVARIYVAEFPFVLRCLRKFGVSSSEQLDLAQEVFVRVLRAAPTAADGPVRPWLMSFASRVAHESRRASNRPICRELCLPIDLPQADEVLQRRQEQLAVNSALNRIAPSRRAVFELSVLEDVAVVEVARRLAISPNTAYSRLRLAKQDLLLATRSPLSRNRSCRLELDSYRPCAAEASEGSGRPSDPEHDCRAEGSLAQLAQGTPVDRSVRCRDPQIGGGWQANVR